MKYYIQRQLNEYGPYTLADLQRYVAQGNIQLTDLARSEGMTEWMPVSQVLGNIPIAAPPQPSVPTAPGGGTVYGGPGTVYAVQPAMAPMTAVPPNFHWALVLLVGVVTCGLFTQAWLIVEAVFVHKVKPQSKAMIMVIIAVACFFLGGFINGFIKATTHGEGAPVGTLFTLAGLVLYLIGIFSMKSELEEYYNTVEPINLQLSGVMTFFFSVYYFQYHYSRIAQWKKTGVLQPQG